MLSNFRKRFIDPLVDDSPPRQEQQALLSSQGDPSNTDSPEQANNVAAQRHWANAMEETVYVAACTCPFCIRHSETNDHARTGRTPAPSYVHRTPRPFPDPPSYSPRDPPPCHAREDAAEISPLMSSTATSVEGIPFSCSRPDPLAQEPSVTGVPSQGIPSGTVPSAELNSIITLVGDVFEDTEPLPAYSRFDQRRPRFPVASDVLGPYPPASVFCQAAR